MRFTISLTDHSSHVVRLVPCPVYEEGLYAGHRPHTSVYQLNCDSVTSIRPGQRVVYAMRIAVPLAAGQAKFGWWIPTASLSRGGVVVIH